MKEKEVKKINLYPKDRTEFLENFMEWWGPKVIAEEDNFPALLINQIELYLEQWNGVSFWMHFLGNWIVHPKQVDKKIEKEGLNKQEPDDFQKAIMLLCKDIIGHHIKQMSHDFKYNLTPIDVIIIRQGKDKGHQECQTKWYLMNNDIDFFGFDIQEDWKWE